MDPVLFSIGDFEIKKYSLFLLIGVLLALFILIRDGKKHGFSADFIFDLTFYAVIFGFIGARAYYVIFNWSDYSTDLLAIFKTWTGGLAIHGGIIAGIISIYFYTKKHKVSFVKMLDLFTIPLLLAQAIGRWGNFFNSEAHGAVTTLSNLQSLHIPQFIIDGMNINGIYYHPTFFYESLWCLLGVVILWLFKRRKYLKIGQLSSLYCIWYGIGRFFIEASRTDSLMLGGFKVAQLVSIVMVFGGIIYFVFTLRKGKYESLFYNESKGVK